ncbi:MAG TPA: hypothetical protein VN783_15025, partial [Thermoanaerobaculia bacterium]|nr:hypothetical protein [Thermoanaerobaculia bacterium]
MSDRNHQEPRDLAALAGRLRAAYAGSGCPPPEVFLEEEWDRLTPAERSRIEEHAATCAACAAERDLARLWDLPADSGDLAPDPADVAYVVSRLRRPAQAIAAPSNVVPFPGARATPPRDAAPVAVRTSRSHRGAWGLALAAALALGIGLTLEMRRGSLPAVPPPTSGEDTHRGAAVLLRGPEGELAAAPRELSWEPVAGAASYRATLREPLGAEVWRGTAKSPRIELPEAVRSSLATAVVYAWGVEAFDAAGARLAGSEPLKFRITPTA